MNLFAIHPDRPEFQPDALPMKISNDVFAVMAFRSVASAQEFMRNKGMSCTEFAVRELTLEEFDRMVASYGKSAPGVSILMKIMDD